MPFNMYDLRCELAWVRQEVAYYPGGLRAEILAKDWSNVDAFAWLPADLPAELREPLDASFVVRLGKDHQPDWEFVAAEIGHVQSLLRRRERALFLYQADYARYRAGVGVRAADGERVLTFDVELSGPVGQDREVWVCLDKDFERSEMVRLTYHRGKWPQHGLGVVTSLPPDLAALPTVDVCSQEAVSALGARAFAVLVPAWRGDSFIFVEWK